MRRICPGTFYDKQIKKIIQRARLCGMKVSILQKIPKSKRLLVWYAGEVVTFEYRGFIIDIGSFSDVVGSVIKDGICVTEFNTSRGPHFKNIVNKYLSNDDAVRTALSEYGSPSVTRSHTIIVVERFPQVEVSIFDVKTNRYIMDYSLGPANSFTVLDAVMFADKFRRDIDDYIDGRGELAKVNQSFS